MTTNRLWLLLLALTVPVCAQDYCSLVVVVRGAQFERDVPVTVREPDGRIIRKPLENLENQVATRFCDLGIRPVEVSVGACETTVVHNVHLRFGITRTLEVEYNSTVCREDGALPAALPCGVFLRFRDEGGGWVSDVELDPPVLGITKVPVRGDSFGRLAFRMAKNQELRLHTKRNGFTPEAINLKCVAPFGQGEEQIVTLLRQR